MIKKHVALSLALFTAGAVYLGSADYANAATSHRHTKCAFSHGEKVCNSYYHTHTTQTVKKKPTKSLFAKKQTAATKKTKITKSSTKNLVAKKHTTKKTKITKYVAKSKPVYNVNNKFSSSHTIRVADDYVGLTEHGSRKQLMNLFNFAFNHKVDPVRTPWCAAFANGVLKKSGKHGTGSLTATSFMSWGRKTSAPTQGDIVVLKPGKRYHVGFYVGTVKRNGKTYVAVLGGNQSNRVKVTYYLSSKVVAYRTAG